MEYQLNLYNIQQYIEKQNGKSGVLWMDINIPHWATKKIIEKFGNEYDVEVQRCESCGGNDVFIRKS